ncbi:MAG: murein biosynthesis integral membrane protein MurJ [Chthoniobacteraceae bacterium]
MSAPTNKLNTRAAGVVGLAVMCSRVLGLVREVLFGMLFGGGRSMDAFIMAFKTPNLLRDMFAEGALSTAFITTFSKKIEREGVPAAWKLANKVGTLLVIFMSIVSVLGVIAAPLLLSITASGFRTDPEKFALTVHLAQIMFPFILLVSLGAQVMGILNARNVFGIPAMASSFFNIGSIIGGVALAWWIDPSFGPRALYGLAVGTLIGGALQLAVQLPSLYRLGYRFHFDFDWRDPGVGDVLRQMGPAIIAASSVQVNVMINGAFASWLEDGTAYRLTVAFRLMQLPLGLFGVALGTVTLPLVSRMAAQGNMAGFSGALSRGMRLALLLTIPSTVGLVLLARPIIGLIYEHGNFSAHAADQAALGLQGYALGLCAYSALKVLTPAFYAIDRRRTPMMIGFLSIAINCGLNYLFAFVFKLGIHGLGLATGCVATLNFVLLYWLMRRATGQLQTRQFIVTAVKLIIPAALLVGICWLASATVLSGWHALPLWQKAVRLFTTIGLGGAAYFGSAMLFRIEEIQDLTALVKRKLLRRPAGA